MYSNVEFSFIKVAVRYMQYIAYKVLIEMMQIVFRKNLNASKLIGRAVSGNKCHNSPLSDHE